MGAWEEYQAAAQRLDRVRRDAATAVAEQAAAVQAARHDLAAVRQRLALQHARITDLAARAGLPPPVLTPDPPAPEPAGPVAAKALLHNATVDLDGADAAVSEVDTGTFTRGPFPDLSQPLRNAVVYAAIAVLVLLVDLWLLFAPSSSLAQVAGLGFAAILPAIGYGVALVSLPLLYGKVERTPVLGAAISAAPVVLLCLWTFASTLL
jgi:hypothetical protein